MDWQPREDFDRPVYRDEADIFNAMDERQQRDLGEYMIQCKARWDEIQRKKDAAIRKKKEEEAKQKDEDERRAKRKRELNVTRTDAYIELKKGFDEMKEGFGTMKEEFGTMKEENNKLREENNALREQMTIIIESSHALVDNTINETVAGERKQKNNKRQKKEDGKGAWYLAGFKKGKRPDSTSHPFVECERCNDYDMFSSPSKDGLSVMCNACYLIIDRDLALDHKCQKDGVAHQEEVEMDSPNKEILLGDDIKVEDEPQFYTNDESSGDDHVVNSILYMGYIYNPDLTIRKI